MWALVVLAQELELVVLAQELEPVVLAQESAPVELVLVVLAPVVWAKPNL